MTPLNSLIAAIVGLVSAAGVIMFIRTLRRRWRPKAGAQGIETSYKSADAGAKAERPVPAREAFLQNISLFAPLLPRLLSDNMGHAGWQRAVAAVGNPELTAYWKKSRGKSKQWRRILHMWGIEPDRRSVITGDDAEAINYLTVSGEPLEQGRSYVVKSPCWKLTESRVASVLLPGTATEAPAKKHCR